MARSGVGSGFTNPLRLGRRIAAASVIANVSLALANVAFGWIARSTSVIAVGVEFGTDALAATGLYAGFVIAARPPDFNHPYGHGRAETVTAGMLGVLLVLTGLSISAQSLRNYGLPHPPPAAHAVWPLLVSLVVKSALMAIKFRQGQKIRSVALVADGWNDSVDILSATAALAAVGLTLYDPRRFLAADHFGGFAIGLIVIGTGLRVARDTSLELMDTMPPPHLMDTIRASAQRVERVKGVEKCWARKTGLRYHVDLHLEVDPQISVAEAHAIAEQVRHQIRREVLEVADVLVHVEPTPPTPGADPLSHGAPESHG